MRRSDHQKVNVMLVRNRDQFLGDVCLREPYSHRKPTCAREVTNEGGHFLSELGLRGRVCLGHALQCGVMARPHAKSGRVPRRPRREQRP